MYIDDQENILNNDKLLGKFEGFIFKPSENFEKNDETDNFIIESFTKKIDRLINEGDAALRLNENFHLTYNDAVIAKLLPTDDIFKPDFTPILDDRIQGIALARLALHLESWLKRQLNTVCDPLDILTKAEDLSQESHDFIKALTENLGYVQRHKIDDIVKKIPSNDRIKLRKAGVKFAQYSVFIRDMLKPIAQKVKLILWSLKNNILLPELPPSGVVTIPFNSNMPNGYYDIAGYKICGEFAVRSDMIEKLADAIRPLALKSENNPKGEFEITAQHMSYIGKSGDAFEAVLKGLGYNYRTEKVNITSAKIISSQAQPNIATTDTDDTKNPNQSIQTTEAENTTDVSVENLSVSSELSNEKEVIITETEVEKKLWFWSPVTYKIKKEFRKPPKHSDDNTQKSNSKRFIKNVSHSNSNDSDNIQSNEMQFKKPKPKNDKNNKRQFDKNDKNKNSKHNDKQSEPYVNMPKTYKIASENNPFAALLALKKTS